MSSVFGKDLTASTLALGKALENPVEGLGALRKVGAEFSATEVEMLQNMVETGKTAEAQKTILDKLAGSLAGSGAGEAKGLTGAAHQVSVSWKNMLEAIGETPAVAGTAQAAKEMLAGAFKAATSLFKDVPLDKQIMGVQARLQEAQNVLQRFRARQPVPVAVSEGAVNTGRASYLFACVLKGFLT